MEVAQEVACQPVRNEADFHHNSGRRLIRISFQHQSQPPETLRKQLLCLLSIAHAPLAPFSIGLKPRPLCVLRGGLGAESSRDRSSPSLLQHIVANGAGKRGGAGASAESGGGGGGGRWPV